MSDPDEWWLSLTRERRSQIRNWIEGSAPHVHTPGQQALFGANPDTPTPPKPPRRDRAPRRAPRRKRKP